MPPPRPSGMLRRAHPPRRCPRSPRAHSPGSGSALSGSHTPQGLALRQPRAARAAAARPLRALSSLPPPLLPPTNLLLPRSSAPIGRHLPPRLTLPPIGLLPARGGAATAGTWSRGPQPGGREGRRGHVGWRGAKGPERPFWGRRGSADPGVLAPEHPLGSVGSAARVRFSTQISVHSPFCPSSPSARAGISFCHFLQKNFFLVSRRQRVLHPCSPALSATRTRPPIVDAHPWTPGLHNQFATFVIFITSFTSF